jgi:transposase-like protein
MSEVIEYKEVIDKTLLGEPITYLVETKRKLIPEDVICKFCGSDDLVRYGKYKGVQHYLCHKCGRKGTDNKALPRKKVPPEVVGAALSMYYEGLSFSAIRRQLWQIYHIEPSRATIYGWVTRYSKVADRLASKVKPKVGKDWVVDETVLKIGGENTWFWDIIDYDTRFLVASHLSKTRSTRDAETVMQKARDRTEKSPQFIISDKLAAYLDGIERVFGANTWHLKSQGFSGMINTNLIERFHGTLKDRTKVMRGMKNRDTAKTILAGFLIFYNFFKPHSALGERTPAQVAGIRFPYKNWTDIVREK